MKRVVDFAQDRIGKSLMKKAALTGAAAASLPVTVAYYGTMLTFNAVLALVHAQRYADALCAVFERNGSVTASDIIGLADDLVPLVNLEALGVDTNALAGELINTLKKIPTVGEIVAAIKALFSPE